MKRPQYGERVKIISWNVNKVCTKLEKANVDLMLRGHDIIALLEVKTTLPVHLPGFVSYRGKSVGTSERGGVVVLVKNHINEFVHNVDTSVGDQLWLQISIFEHVMFGFCYIPPCDSPYYTHDAFAAIQEKIQSNNMSNGYVIMGDMNARFGKAVRDLGAMYELPDTHISYPNIEDDVGTMNDNAEFLSTICLDNKLLVLNQGFPNFSMPRTPKIDASQLEDPQ